MLRVIGIVLVLGRLFLARGLKKRSRIMLIREGAAVGGRVRESAESAESTLQLTPRIRFSRSVWFGLDCAGAFAFEPRPVQRPNASQRDTFRKIFRQYKSTCAPQMSHHHWNYCDDDECGPAHWPGANGQHQSPIDIDLAGIQRKDTVDAIKFVNYERILSGIIVNNGHSVQVVPDDAIEHPEIYGGGLDQVYRLIQYHFHWGESDNEGSEHRLGGLSYPAELHLVHQGIENPDRLAVVGVFLRLGKDGRVLADEEKSLRDIVECGMSTRIDHVKMSSKLPKNRGSFFRYEGSLTTPPCSEVVTWTLFTEAIDISREQLQLLRNLHDCEHKCLKKNYRPAQPLNNRTVYHIVAKH